ncbi:sigma factor-like helix-turn-helix DNA-binding protein [Sphingosinicella sp. LHD-64]|uniref:RNA polymerase sigma factor n=1 Tax=Sphingosinicella sp. LHD-64 TaxID=3072139 RepID=UPI00280DAD0B|nr:sigma factor-like helix-turn-helix DNA-binding protein [Sphingosinicella sp. LHD-64]MDQ8757411.1 sigma factor-like helix-turn-helix DNA-binding protein [Sphingosinicella sp. LHD-64]
MAVDHERRAAMQRAVAALPLWPREVFILHAVDGLDYAAIAARLGIGIDEVEARFAEAICRIARILPSDEA